MRISLKGLHAIFDGVIETLLQELLLFGSLLLNLQYAFLIFHYVCSFDLVPALEDLRFVGLALHVVHEGQIFLYFFKLTHLLLLHLLLMAEFCAHRFVFGPGPEVGLLKDVLQLLPLMEFLHFLLEVF